MGQVPEIKWMMMMNNRQKYYWESKQSKNAIFFHLTWLMVLHYLAKQKTRKLYLFTQMFHVHLPVDTQVTSELSP